MFGAASGLPKCFFMKICAADLTKATKRPLDSSSVILDSRGGQGGISMPNGIVKWFNNAKGYGFIVPDDGGDDLFAHFSAVTMDGYKTLSAGDQVQFDVTVGEKGPQATSIVATGTNTGLSETDSEKDVGGAAESASETAPPDSP
jgi:CspA family cold shock protein